MRLNFRLMASIFATSCLIATASAATASKHSHNPPSATVQKILTELDKKANIPSQPSSLVKYLNKEQQRQQEVLNELINKTSGIALNEKVKLSLLAKLNAHLKSTQVAKNLFSQDSNPDINFLILQLGEANNMLNAVSTATTKTYTALKEMYTLALAASNGTHTDWDLYNINLTFQAYKQAIQMVQHTDLMNGEKIVSGGNISIQIGEGKNSASLLTISIPAFDVNSLGIANSDVSSQLGAHQALDELQHAMNILYQIITVVGSDRIYDAQAMIASVSPVLYQDYLLFAHAEDLIMQSANGIYSDEQRHLLNTSLDYVKDALVKTQTYVSLDGVKMLGGGNLHIQIGNVATPETTLVIKLPVTDITKLGMNSITINTQAEAYNALDFMASTLYNFTYGPAIKN